MKKFLILVVFFSISLVQAQNLKPNRDAFALKVQVNSKQFYAQQVNDSPYFAEEKTLQIYADEKVFIEVEVENGTIISLTSVAENLNPEKTFEIEFCQTIKDNISKESILYIKNPFDKKLKYDCLVYVIDSSKWEAQNYDVKAKTTKTETWKDVLGSIVIRNWELQ
jgi:hypothetical protein